MNSESEPLAGGRASSNWRFESFFLAFGLSLLVFFYTAVAYCQEAGAITNAIPVNSPTNPASVQQSEMVYIYNGPESPADHRYDYHWRVLRAALEKTVQKYGPYRMEAANFMTEDRQVFELEKQTGKLNVLIRGDTLEYEKAFEAVWIPVDKGLLGYRVFLIRREDQPHFTSATTLEELQHDTIGQGSDWKDIDILRANGLKAVPGGDYAGLFAMLANGRFDLFSRGVEEVQDEYLLHQKQFPNLTIETNLMLYYPIARYFWFAKSDQGRQLAQRVREGMMMMVEDGTLDRMFETEHEQLINELNLKNRKLFILKNSFAAPEVPLDDKRLWYSPLNQKKSAPENISPLAQKP